MKCYCKPDANGKHPTACRANVATLPDHNNPFLLRQAFARYIEQKRKELLRLAA